MASAFVEVPVGGDDLDALVWSLLITQRHQEPLSTTKKVCTHQPRSIHEGMEVVRESYVHK